MIYTAQTWVYVFFTGQYYGMAMLVQEGAGPRRRYIRTHRSGGGGGGGVLT